jgi:hypothetical protein
MEKETQSQWSFSSAIWSDKKELAAIGARCGNIFFFTFLYFRVVDGKEMRLLFAQGLQCSVHRFDKGPNANINNQSLMNCSLRFGEVIREKSGLVVYKVRHMSPLGV